MADGTSRRSDRRGSKGSSPIVDIPAPGPSPPIADVAVDMAPTRVAQRLKEAANLAAARWPPTAPPDMSAAAVAARLRLASGLRALCARLSSVSLEGPVR